MWKTSTLLRCIEETKTSMQEKGLKMLTDNNAVATIYDINQLINKRYPDEPDLLIIPDTITDFGIDVVNDKINYRKRIVEVREVREVSGQRISKFLSKNSKLRPEQIATITSDIKNKMYYIIFASSNYRIWYVSANERAGIGSCMSYPARHFHRHAPDYNETVDKPHQKYLHPVAAYEGCDEVTLALMFNSNPYEWDGESDYPLIARALIGRNTDFCRIYAKNSSLSSSMRQMLKSAGYTNDDCILDGLTLSVQQDREGNYVVPYFDPDNRKYTLCTQTHTITIDEDDGDYHTEHSNGMPEEIERPTQFCDHCAEDHPEDEGYAVLYNSSGYENGIVVGACRNNSNLVWMKYDRMEGYTDDDYATWSDYEDGYIHNSTVYQIWGGDGIYITYNGSCEYEAAIELHEEVDGCENADPEICIETVENQYFLKDMQSDRYFQCAIDGEYYSVDDHGTDQLERSGLIINTANLEINE